MKILILGSGFVAGPCINYLVKFPNYHITVASRNIQNSQKQILHIENATAISLDVFNDSALQDAISQHDLVISLIPYIHHARVISAAIKSKKHVVTTSYISPAMQELHQAAKDAGITVFNEIGVDPGIDHLYAIKTIDQVHKENGKILSFLSYCGGLPAPEASNNPLGYKFSWSSRGVLLALRNSAKYVENGQIVTIPGHELMSSAKPIQIYPAFAFVGYPNRDSTPYNERYAIPECMTVLRGTLRYSVFPGFVKVLVLLGLLNDDPVDELNSSSNENITWKSVLAKALDTSCDQDILSKTGLEGDEATHIIHGFKWLGLLSDNLVIKRGNLLDTLCATLEEKMQYLPGERDMVMLQHKFIVELADGTIQNRTSTGLWFGVPNGPSAMATTVGVPCGIAARLILQGEIKERGVLAPMTPELVYPLIKALEAEGIIMIDEIQ